ncbi:LON peptidase substrate-binding domain-containing protein [Aeromicrobium marinum]|uniref:LON peptidase substrate-binding domain-containing protein n=1 Tax=Aeromicrobium marinum TaxID=219314 RepID=UPI0001BCDCAA|nr:LON peptidase substrate-binding domain-containing protein [Aeromicrobium marinum]
MPSATPMFPLGSALLPGMPLPLRLFEPRYLAMLQVVMERQPTDFGVVLIERGTEAGGGETRFDVGTMATIEQIAPDGETFVLIARGTTRFTVDRWLPDDPYPQAEISELAPLEWSDELASALIVAEDAVRTHLARAAEFVELPWSADIVLDDDPVERSWQLAGIALLGELDHVEALRSTSVGELLDRTVTGSQAGLDQILFNHGPH